MKLAFVFLTLLLFAIGTFSQTTGEVPARMLSAQPFVLSKEAEQAGIEGQISFEVEIDKQGLVKNIDFLAGPMWPCTAEPKREINALKDAISTSVREAKFEPAIKGGKPRSSKLVMRLRLSKPNIPEPFDLQTADRIVIRDAIHDGLIVSRPVSSLNTQHPFVQMRRRPEPEFSSAVLQSAGKAKILIIVRIDKTGKVLSAGAVTGPAILLFNTREAACQAEFNPLNDQGDQISLIQTLSYYVNGHMPSWVR